MVDYYGLPRTWPGRERPSRHATLSERAATVERAVLEDISTAIDRPARFVPYVVMHEFEGLLFSDPDRFAQSLGKPSLAPKLRAVRREFQTPEDINDSPDKSPSKRILNLYRGYRKPVDGVLAMAELGLDMNRARGVSALQRVGQHAGAAGSAVARPRPAAKRQPSLATT